MFVTACACLFDAHTLSHLKRSFSSCVSLFLSPDPLMVSTLPRKQLALSLCCVLLKNAKTLQQVRQHKPQHIEMCLCIHHTPLIQIETEDWFFRFCDTDTCERYPNESEVLMCCFFFFWGGLLSQAYLFNNPTHSTQKHSKLKKVSAKSSLYVYAERSGLIYLLLLLHVLQHYREYVISC